MSWVDAELQDLVFLQRGFDITKAQQRPGTIPVISSSGPQSFHNEAKVKGPGVVIGRKGSVGTVYYTDADFWPHDTTLWSKDLKGNDPKFVYYFLQTLRLSRFDTGNSNPTLNRNHIHKLPIKKPDLDEQKRIASVLSAYDDLIKNNQRRVALLEEAARLLYSEWFVHFRFPGHEHVKVIDGVPEGWERNSLFDCVDVLSGGTPKTTEPAYWGDEIPFFTPKDTGDGPYTYDTEKMITEEGLKRCNSKLYDKDTLFVTARGTVGKIRLGQRPMAMNQSCYALQSTTHLDQAFLYFGVTEQVNYMKSHAVGAVFDAIIVDTFKKIPFLLPEKAIADEFSEIAKNALRQIDVLSSQNRQLTKARGLLLPRLMDGRLEV